MTSTHPRVFLATPMPNSRIRWAGATEVGSFAFRGNTSQSSARLLIKHQIKQETRTSELLSLSLSLARSRATQGAPLTGETQAQLAKLRSELVFPAIQERPSLGTCRHLPTSAYGRPLRARSMLPLALRSKRRLPTSAFLPSMSCSLNSLAPKASHTTSHDLPTGPWLKKTANGREFGEAFGGHEFPNQLSWRIFRFGIDT